MWVTSFHWFAILVENDNGTLTVYAITACPSTAMEIAYSMINGSPVPMAIAQNAPLNFGGVISTGTGIAPISESVAE